MSEDRRRLRFTFAVKELGDPAIAAMVGDGFISLLSDQIGEDAGIWEHKTYLERPALSDMDGPIMQFRSWAQQFYAASELTPPGLGTGTSRRRSSAPAGC